MYQLSIINYDCPLYNVVTYWSYLDELYKHIDICSDFFHNVLSHNDVLFNIKKL